MSTTLKLLLIYNDPAPGASTYNIVSAVPGPNLDDPTFTNISVKKVATALPSNKTLSAVWDSASGNVFVAIRRSGERSNIGVGTIRPGCVMGQTDYAAGSLTPTEPSVMSYQGVPQLLWNAALDGESPIQAYRTDVRDASGTLTILNLNGPGMSSLKTASSPRLLRVGNDHIYMFYMDATNNTRMNMAAIDTVSYRNLWTAGQNKDPTSVMWSSYFTIAALSGQLKGWPAVAVTGSGSTMKINVFVMNTAGELRYFYFQLGSNGLVQPYDISLNWEPTGTRVPAMGEMRLTSCKAGNLSAAVYNGRLFVFYIDSDTPSATISYMSCKVGDEGKWKPGVVSSSTIPLVSNAAGYGGVSAVFVQSDF